MIKLLGKLPRKVYLGISGGPDSMAAYDFLSRNHEVIPVFFNHGTDESDKAEKFLKDSINGKEYSEMGGEQYGEQHFGKIQNPTKPKGKSWEEYWREERYKFFKEVINREAGCVTVPGYPDIQLPERHPFFITAHHLDDCVETYLFSAIHGKSKIIQSFNGLIHHPFLLNKKAELVKWCDDHKVPYLEAESNKDLSHPRNRIRHNIIPEVLKVNPGIYKTVAKKILGAQNGNSN